MSCETEDTSRLPKFDSTEIKFSPIIPPVDHSWIIDEFYAAFKDLGIESDTTKEKFERASRRSFENTSEQWQKSPLPGGGGAPKARSLGGRLMKRLELIVSDRHNTLYTPWRAIHEGEPVGSITTMISFNDKSGEWTCEVGYLLVRPVARGRGLGSIMLTHAEQALRDCAADYTEDHISSAS